VRYFLVVIAIFGLLHLPLFQRWEWLTSTANRAALALAIGVFLSGVHHAVFARHYVDLLPENLPAKSFQVYLSVTLRMLFGIGLIFLPTRIVSAVGMTILLCLVLPVNIRVAIQGNTTGQLVAAGWFLWLRLVVHASWIAWCGWFLTLKHR